jgi:hypothetical protein
MDSEISKSCVERIKRRCSVFKQCAFYRADTEECRLGAGTMLYRSSPPENPVPYPVQKICPVDGKPDYATFEEVKYGDGTYCDGYRA